MASPRTRQNSLTVVLLAGAAHVAAAGCGGPDRAHVSGRIVRRDGAPVVNAGVLARSDKTGKWAAGGTDQDGRYALGGAKAGDGIPPGDYYMTVTETFPETDHPPPPTIPAKYADPGASGLTLHLEAGENKVFDVTLDAL